jgi:hypothetical protein
VDRTERCVVLGAEVIGHTVSNTVAATVLVSGSSEVRPALRKLIDARNPEFNWLKVVWREKNGDVLCELATEGRAVVDEGTEQISARVLRESLAAAKR